jgi:acyl-CoA synthetase (AMP-forming)/AMP-acid ligase II
MDLGRIARSNPDKPAIIMSADGRTVSYGELDRRSTQVARLLTDHGIGKGDHIAILMDNRAEYLEVAWAAQRSGIYYTPVNWHLTEAEAAYVVDDCGARALFTGEGVGELASHVRDQCPRLELSVMVGKTTDGFFDYETELINRSSEPLLDEAEGIYFFYSSGTTGMPKGIEPVHEFPPFGTGLPIDHVIAASFGFDSDTVYLCPAPLYHAAPLGWSLGTHRNGGTVVIMERFDALECLRAIEHHRVSHVQFVPTHFVRMLKLPVEDRESVDLSSLKVAVHAAAPCPVEVKQQMIDWLGPKVLEYYAGSEGTGMTAITSQDWLTHRGSVGKAALGTVHILGDFGVELPVGEVGTVYFSGGGTFRYHNDEAKTAKAFNSRGWATLGDMGHLDEEGYLYLADRRTDLIISGGVNIYPAEIEDALVMHPSVADVAVIGIADDEMGQSVRAVVQAAAGVTPDPDLALELMAFARQKLAGFKCPRSIVFTDQIPRLPTGKLLRRRVRESAAGSV